MESYLLSGSCSLCFSPSLPATHSLQCVTLSCEQFSDENNKKKNPSIFLRNDNCIRRVEKEVTDCQQEHVEEAKKEMNIIYLEVAFKDDGFL